MCNYIYTERNASLDAIAATVNKLEEGEPCTIMGAPVLNIHVDDFYSDKPHASY